MRQILVFIVTIFVLYAIYLVITRPKKFIPYIFMNFKDVIAGHYSFWQLWLHCSVLNILAFVIWSIFKKNFIIIAIFSLFYIIYHLFIFIGYWFRTADEENPFIEFLQRLSFFLLITLPSCGLGALALLIMLEFHNLRN